MNTLSCILVTTILGSTLLPMPAFACKPGDKNVLPPASTELYAFTQRKTVAAISRPLVSSGILGLRHNSKLVWQTRQPLKSTMVISAQGLKQYSREDVLINEVTNPAITGIAKIFLDLFGGDAGKLADSFVQTPVCNETGDWQLVLIPQKPALRKLLVSLELSGADSIEKITFHDAGGDSTEILLTPAPAIRPEELESYLGD